MNILDSLRFLTGHPLNRNRKLKAVLNYFRWQIGSRLVPGPVAVPFVNNAHLLVSPGMTGATGNIYTGLHEFGEMAFLLHMLRPDDLFVDVGANIGSYTILASAAIGASSIAIEPLPEAYRHLLRNICLNNIGDLVQTHNIGMGREDSLLRFTSGLDTVNHVASTDEIASGDTLEVRAASLDNTIGELDPGLIKIDVEGFETNVVAGAARVLSQNSLHAVIMELNGSGSRYGFDEALLHKQMLDYGFATFSYSPFDRKLMPLQENRSSSGNMIYIKNSNVVRDRISSAPKFSVQGRHI